MHTAVVGGVAVNQEINGNLAHPGGANCRRPNIFGNKLTTSSLLYIYLETRYTAIRQSFLTVYIVLEWWDIDHQCLLCNGILTTSAFDVLRTSDNKPPFNSSHGKTIDIKTIETT